MRQLRTFLEIKKFHRIALKKLATGHYVFTAKVNGIKGNFILDTGASTSCIGFNSSHHFLLTAEESRIKAAGAGAINMKTKISRKNDFILGTWVTKNMDFVLFDLSHVNEALDQAKEKAVHGIIGADFLKKTRAVIDYGRNALYVR